jgi:hypothetical protein
LFGRNGIRSHCRRDLLDAAHFARELFEPAGAAAAEAVTTSDCLRHVCHRELERIALFGARLLNSEGIRTELRMRRLQRSGHLGRRTMQHFGVAIAPDGRRLAVQGLHVECTSRVHTTCLGVGTTSATPQDAPFLLQELQRSTHCCPRYSISGDEIRLARQGARRFEFAVGQ